MNYVIIVAGGIGRRMNSTTPKQFLLLHGKPVLLRTIEAFYQYSSSVKIILGLPQPYIKEWEELCHHHEHQINEKIVEGGETRFQTVKKCLEEISESNGCVAIHDGVRPLISREIIKNSFLIAKTGIGAVTTVPLKESLRTNNPNGQTRAVDREEYVLVQTPQTFPVQQIKEAYQQKELPSFTDDASVFEKAGFLISLIQGSERNIKITTPFDLEIASVLYKNAIDKSPI